MNNAIQLEDRVSRSRSKHEGESSAEVCDRLSRTRVSSQRQLPTDHDYAVPTREYQLDQSSPLPATAAADPVLEKAKAKTKQKTPQRFEDVDRVTPYQLPSGRSHAQPRAIRELMAFRMPTCRNTRTNDAHISRWWATRLLFMVVSLANSWLRPWTPRGKRLLFETLMATRSSRT